MRSRGSRVFAGVVAAAVGLSGVVVAEPVGATDTVQAGAKAVAVTLITGDRVVVHDPATGRATVERAKGREGIGFRTYQTKGHLHVVPADQVRAVAEGRVDQRLFDVTGLIADGYDDASAGTIPVLATHGAKRPAPKGATAVRALPSIGGTAMRVSKRHTAGFLSSGFAKVWLDGKRKISLDQSVPQIGGPNAWQAGLTGKGVSVAVLDTGIDATHPDLAGQVAGAKNFTSEPADDIVGHGTHVASTIAGTGAASDGKYKGVAPEAKLYDGKVCEEPGCPESAILAGMEWAAKDVQAGIVNLSLSGIDTPELDPVELAVNRLTADTGTLFVIAAGNEGPDDGTVGSPASAESALAVGAVDKEDQLAPYSSRGPRVGDGGIKPEVTAPGTNIVAAKSTSSSIGEPVGDRYLRLSGTSMATPHTAGAAALLHQQHPAWTPGELKSALMGSAKAAGEQTAFQQGAGRIDLAAAIKQTVIAEQPSVSFGTASYPHDDDEPVTKTVSYRNLGTEPVTLNLTATLTDPNGEAAPTGALSLSVSALTIPAGGTASVQATSNTDHSGGDGLYSGRIVAATNGQSVVLPVGVNKQVESHTLTVKLVRPDGGPSEHPVWLAPINGKTPTQHLPDENGVVRLQLPRGEYLLDQFSEFEAGPDNYRWYAVVAPSVKLDTDRTVVLDARQAKGFSTTVPNPSAVQADSDVGYRRTAPDGTPLFSPSLIGFDFGKLFTLSVGPNPPAAQLTGHVTSLWGQPNPDGSFTNSPYLYSIADHQPGEFPTGFQRTVRASDLATVDRTVHKTTEPQARITSWPQLPGFNGGLILATPLTTPRSIRHYLDQTPKGWITYLDETSTDPSKPIGDWSLNPDTPKHYQAGRSYRERWNSAAFGPGVVTAIRAADKLKLELRNLTDADGHLGYAKPTNAGTTLSRDGAEIARTSSFGTIDAQGLPAGKASYKLVTTATQTATPFATRVDLEATFTSSADSTTVPIHTVTYRPATDPHNTVLKRPGFDAPSVM